MLWSSPTDRRSKLLKETNLGVLPPRVSPGQRWASSSRNLPSAVVAWDLWGGNGRGRVGPGAGTSPPRPRRTVLKAPARPPSRVPEAQTGKPPEDSGGGAGHEGGVGPFLLPPWPPPPAPPSLPPLPSFPPQTRLKSISAGPDAACPSRGAPVSGQGADKQAGAAFALRGARGGRAPEPGLERWEGGVLGQGSGCGLWSTHRPGRGERRSGLGGSRRDASGRRCRTAQCTGL